jgi:hypothetical protein
MDEAEVTQMVTRALRAARHARTGFKRAEAGFGAIMNRTEEGTHDWQVARYMRDEARKKREVLDGMLREVEREEQKDRFQVLGQDKGEEGEEWS